MGHSQWSCLCCRQQLRSKDWRKALIGDRWFTEGGFIVGGRPTKDLSWFKELRKPFWWVCTEYFHRWCTGVCLLPHGGRPTYATSLHPHMHAQQRSSYHMELASIHTLLSRESVCLPDTARAALKEQGFMHG